MVVYRILGFFFLALAIIGVILPILPTTPFVILAAGFFSKSSKRMHKWLTSSRIFGPMIKKWEENHCISLTTKIVALSCLFFFGGYSVLFRVHNPYVKIFGLVIIMIGAFYVLRLDTCISTKEESL